MLVKNYFWSSYCRKILWVIGLVALSFISFNYKNQIQQTASETFNVIPIIWSNSLTSILFGIYLSLILVKKWSLNINRSLLWCVSIPCMLLSLALPIFATLSTFEYLPENISSSSFSFWLIKISSTDLFGIIAGLTIILSFFNAHSNKKNQ